MKEEKKKNGGGGRRCGRCGGGRGWCAFLEISIVRALRTTATKRIVVLAVVEMEKGEPCSRLEGQSNTYRKSDTIHSLTHAPTLFSNSCVCLCVFSRPTFF